MNYGKSDRQTKVKWHNFISASVGRRGKGETIVVFKSQQNELTLFLWPIHFSMLIFISHVMKLCNDNLYVSLTEPGRQYSTWSLLFLPTNTRTYITSPIPQTIWTFLTEVCYERKYMNKNMEQREERADFYIIHWKTFLKAKRGCHIPKAIRECLQDWCPQHRQISIFLGLCLRLWVQHFSSSSLRFQRNMSVACHECRTDNSSSTSSHIQACPDINTHTGGKMWFLCIENPIFS